MLENSRSAKGFFAGTSKITGEETLFVYRRLSGFPLTFSISVTIRAIIMRSQP